MSGCSAYNHWHNIDDSEKYLGLGCNNSCRKGLSDNGIAFTCQRFTKSTNGSPCKHRGKLISSVCRQQSLKPLPYSGGAKQPQSQGQALAHVFCLYGEMLKETFS